MQTEEKVLEGNSWSRYTYDRPNVLFGGDVKSVQSLVKKYAVKVNIDDTTSAIFEFKKKCTGNLTTIFACPYTTTFNIFGTNMNIFQM